MKIKIVFWTWLAITFFVPLALSVTYYFHTNQSLVQSLSAGDRAWRSVAFSAVIFALLNVWAPYVLIGCWKHMRKGRGIKGKGTVLTGKYTNSDQGICAGDRVLIDGDRVGTVLGVFAAGTEEASDYSCSETGGVLLETEGAGCELLLFGNAHTIYRDLASAPS